MFELVFIAKIVNKFEILLGLIFIKYLEDKMKKLLALLAVAALVAGCAAKKPVKEYHPTDDVNASSQGGKGMEGDGSEVDFGLDDEPADGDVKAFHPTDALLIGGNGPFNAAPDKDDIIDLEQNDEYENVGTSEGSNAPTKKYDNIDK